MGPIYYEGGCVEWDLFVLEERRYIDMCVYI